MPMVLRRSKKTLEDGLKEIAVLIDIKGWDTFLPLSTNESKRKSPNSTKVFSAFPWRWSYTSLQFPKDAVESSGSSEPCRPDKEEELTKFGHNRKSKLLQKQEDENNDWTKAEKIRLSVESLESEILRLQHSISTQSALLGLV
ncbi:hypothetical protein TB2_011026 [Malus domestica]